MPPGEVLAGSSPSSAVLVVILKMNLALIVAASLIDRCAFLFHYDRWIAATSFGLVVSLQCTFRLQFSSADSISVLMI